MNDKTILSYYYNSIKRIPQLSHEESIDLFKKYSNGDSRAKKKLIESNLRLVISIANNYKNSGIPLEDLIQEGNLGLIKSIEKFDVTKGYKFSTYSTWWIRQSIGMHLTSKKRTIKIPQHAKDAKKKTCSAIDEYKKEFGIEPTLEELSDLIGISKNIISASLNSSKATISLTHPINDEFCLEEIIKDESSMADPFRIVSEKEMISIINNSLNLLSPKEMIILKLRYGLMENPKNHCAWPITKEELEKIKKGNGLTNEK